MKSKAHHPVVRQMILKYTLQKDGSSVLKYSQYDKRARQYTHVRAFILRRYPFTMIEDQVFREYVFCCVPPLKSKSLCEKNAWLFIIICMLKYTKFLQIWRQDLVEDKWTSLQKLYESFMHHIIK